jgi:CSLREA domain-containing protein
MGNRSLCDLRGAATVTPRIRAAVAALLFAPAALAAAEIPTTTLVDEPNADNGNCTLREAILAAMVDEAQDLCPAGSATEPDLVLLSAGTYEWKTGQVFFNIGGPLVVRGPQATPPTARIDVDPVLARRFVRLLNGADLTVENVEIANGDVRADQDLPAGGAIAAGGLSDVDLTLRNVWFTGNRAAFGGAVYFETSSCPLACSLTVERSVFFRNRAEVTGVAGFPRGGGLHAQVRGSTVARIVDSTFRENEVLSTFAGNGAGGGGLSAGSSGASVLEVRRTIFRANRADAGEDAGPVGAGAYVTPAGSSTARLVDLRFEENELVDPVVVAGALPASALHLVTSFDAVLTLDRVALLGNDPGDAAVQLRLQHLSSAAGLARNVLVADGPARGAHVSNASSELTLAHWTVATHPGEGLRLERGSATLRLDNSLLFGNGTDLAQSGFPTVDPSNLIGVDPLFADPAAGDYRLGPLSPALDDGDRTLDSAAPFDLGHGPRVVGEQVDVGAYELGALFADDFESALAAWSEVVP